METPAKELSPVVVVMVPLPAQGHLNQLLHLSRVISDRSVPVHFAGSAAHNRQAKIRVQGWDLQAASNIHFHDLPVPPCPVPPPDPNSPNKFPSHLEPTFEAFVLHLRQPFTVLLRSLSSTARRIVVIHDALMSFIAKESSAFPNVEPYIFNCSSAFTSFMFFADIFGKPAGVNIPDLPTPPFDGCFTESFMAFVGPQVTMMEFGVGEIYNTCRAIEGDYLDLLPQLPSRGKRTSRPWAIGPVNPISVKETIKHKCLDWLDHQPMKSVLYVSFGTTSTLSDGQILELAMGLKQSGQRFIWVLREADRGNIFVQEEGRKSPLPDNYEEQLKGMGMVVTDWAPQLNILAHQATGGFLTHCGWNSSIEGISMGVPLLTWPMHSDQPMNAMLITKVLKIGIPARDWAKRNEVSSSADVEVVVRRLMASEEGDFIRKRAEELGGAVRKAWSEGGSSRNDLDGFIAHISR